MSIAPADECFAPIARGYSRGNDDRLGCRIADLYCSGMRKHLGVALLTIAFGLAGQGQHTSTAKHPPPAALRLCDVCVQADMSFLASDELHGRGSATRDEHLAAQFAASLFQSFGLAPGGDNGSFLQKAKMPSPLPSQVLVRLNSYEKVPRDETWNAVGILRGTDAGKDGEAILLTAHLDHLGIGPAVKGDAIYNLSLIHI